MNTRHDIEAARNLLSPPGDTLAETLEFEGISQTDLARRMGRPEKTISEIINGKAAITPETAQQLALVLGIPASFWLQRENNYRLELAELEQAEKMLEAHDWCNSFPLKEMQRKFGLDFGKSPVEQARGLYAFFGVADANAYAQTYQQRVYAASYRMQAKEGKNAHAVAAWLRQGERQAKQQAALPAFDATRLKAALPHMKTLMQTPPEDWFSQLQALCASAGICVLHTPCLPKMHIHGASRWVGDIPLIQLSNHYKRNDIFWFTFFHEIGHILLHGKRDFFIETPDTLAYTPEEQRKEDQANAFAMEQTLPEGAEDVILQHSPLTREAVLAFARQYQTHPAMIVGRLARKNQHYNKHGHTWGFFAVVELSA